MTADDASVTAWIGRMKAGDDDAAQQLWQHYIARLTRLADTMLGAAPRGVSDEEDVAAEAFRQLFDSARRGVFPRLHDRNDLWQVLAMLTRRRAIEHQRRASAQRRGGGAARQDSPDEQRLLLDQLLADGEPGPDEALQLKEQLERLLDGLDETHRAVATAKLAGCTNQEIAERLGISRRSVERKIPLIRTRWLLENTDDDSGTGEPR